MSDSNITKNALAQALKELIKTRPIDKISVGNICDYCGLNRKSFYYHFQDKYQLINWIYYTEFLNAARSGDQTDSWEFLKEICNYFSENRIFYAKIFRIEGQNSFSEYFSSVIFSVLSEHLPEIFPEEEFIAPFAEFYTDAFVCAFKKWLSKKDCIPPEEFALFLKKALLSLGQKFAKSNTEKS